MAKCKKLSIAVLFAVMLLCSVIGLFCASGVNAEDNGARVLTQADMENFSAIIAENPSGTYELGEDIDFGGATLSESIVFGGTLDGKGYALKNFKLGIAEVSGWNSRFISENNGTIKNIGLYITSVQANNNEFGFIRANKGTVSNVFVNFNYDSSLIINEYCHYGTIAMQNDGGTIENCVVNITVAEGVDIGVGQGADGVNIFAAISAYNVNGGIIKNCHAVIGENNIGIAIYPWATQENNATYATMAELAAAITFSAENGWNTDYWHIEDNAIKFCYKNNSIFEMLGASIRYETASDKESGIRFGVKLDTASFEKYTAADNTETGILLIPESKSAGITEITIDTPEVKKAVTFDAENNKWGAYKENGQTVEGFVQAVAYLWNIPVANYNDNIKAAAYIKSGDTVVYSDTVCICINEVALRTLKTETDENRKSQLNAYLQANDYTVEFKDGETVMQTGTYKYGDTVVAPDTEKEGYSFLGWDKDIGTVTGDATYNASYKSNARVLTQADVANFKTLLDGSTGSFVLGEDLDFENLQTEDLIDFGGTLDGNGYSIKNLRIQYNDRSDWSSYYFSNLTGTIKNIGIEYSIWPNSDNSGLILKNNGTVSNVFIKVTINSGDKYRLGPIAKENYGTVENCVVVMNKGDGVTFTDTSLYGSLVAIDCNSTVKNSYGVTNGITENFYGMTWGNGTLTNCANYTTMAELAAAITFSAENGWNTEYTERLFAEILDVKKN